MVIEYVGTKPRPVRTREFFWEFVEAPARFNARKTGETQREPGADIKQALRLVLCLTNPSALPGARWLLRPHRKRIPAGSTNKQ